MQFIIRCYIIIGYDLLFNGYYFYSDKSILSLENKNLKWGGGYHFHISHIYSICFETSIYQFNSSKRSPIMPDEFREHLTRDQRPFLHPESLQIL